MKIKDLKKEENIVLSETKKLKVKGGHNWFNSPSRTGDGTRSQSPTTTDPC